MRVIQVRLVPGRWQQIVASVDIEELVGANAKEWMIESHLPCTAPELQAQEASALLEVEEPLKTLGTDKRQQDEPAHDGGTGQPEQRAHRTTLPAQ